MTVPLALQIVALVLLLLASLSISIPKVQAGWLGLAAYVAAAVWVGLKL